MTEEQSPDFRSELLVAEAGAISGEAGNYSITIKLQPFNYDDEAVDQTLEINNVPLPTESPSDLSGREFSFPPNPNDGYVETSIYIWSVHNPIDVLRIKFHVVKDEIIGATFDMRFAFEYEGCCNNLEKTLSLPLKIQ